MSEIIAEMITLDEGARASLSWESRIRTPRQFGALLEVG